MEVHGWGRGEGSETGGVWMGQGWGGAHEETKISAVRDIYMLKQLH